MSIIPTLVEFILGNKQSIGVQCFNNLGEDSIVKLLENLKPMSTKNRNLFVQNSKGLDGDFSVALLSAISKEKVLKSLAEPMLKVHNKAIRKYCQVKSLKYKDFVENWSK